MKKKQIKKLLITSFAVVASVFSVSICAQAAQIEALSVVDNTIYAKVNAENARLYAAEYNGGLLSDAFFGDIDSDGNIELPIGTASDCALFLWDKESLAPISVTYELRDGMAYPKGEETPVPEYEFSSYSFNQDDAVMIVSSISDTEITGFKAGVETTYSFTDEVTVLGLGASIDEVVPGSVVLIGTNALGKCAAIELLATVGIPVDLDVFKANYGVYSPSDGSDRYLNVVDVMFGKGSNVVTLREKYGAKYCFESVNTICYRVGIAMDGDTPVITYKSDKVYPTTLFENTASYNNLLYLRVDKEKSNANYDGLVTQCVIYCIPKNFNPGAGDGEYSDIFSAKPVVIIE